MSFSKDAIDNAWAFESHIRGATSRLFDDNAPNRRQDRNRVYREALLTLCDALAHESPFLVREAIDMITDIYPTTLKTAEDTDGR